MIKNYDIQTLHCFGFGMPRKSTECFSESFRFLLDWYGLKQKGFAEIFETNTSTVSRWASGRDVPTWTTFDKVCTFFDVEPDEMLDVKKLMSRFVAQNVPRTLPKKKNLVFDKSED